MLDDLFDMVTDRSREKRRGSSGGLLGRIGQMLQVGSDADEDRRDDREYRRRDDRRDYRRDDDDDDERGDRRDRRRRDFDLDFGD